MDDFVSDGVDREGSSAVYRESGVDTAGLARPRPPDTGVAGVTPGDPWGGSSKGTVVHTHPYAPPMAH
jgi:hypothetical protein